jgi:hypothetical protein
VHFHFDNAAIHNWKVVTGKSMEEELHLALSYRLYFKDKFIHKQYATPQELTSVMEMIIPEIRSDLISRVFTTWQERL